MVDNTSASSGEITSSRSASVLEGVIYSSGISSQVAGSRYWMRQWCGQFGEFLDPDSGVTQHLYHRPGAEPAVFFEAEITAPTADWVLGPDAAGGLGLHHRASQCHPGGGEQLPGAGGFGGGEQFGGAATFGRGPGDQGRQHWKPFAGAGVRPGLAA